MQATPRLAVTAKQRSSQLKGEQFQRSPQAFGDIDRARRRALRQDQAEFVAAEPGHQVVRMPVLLQQTRDLAEQAIAGQMTTAVVDVLELVEVEQDQPAG